MTKPLFGGTFARCAPCACPVRFICIKILSLALSSSSPSEFPQVDRKHSVQTTVHKLKYEKSTTQNVTTTTSNHQLCKRRARILDTAIRYSTLFGEGGQKQPRVRNGNKKDALFVPSALILLHSPYNQHTLTLCLVSDHKNHGQKIW